MATLDGHLSPVYALAFSRDDTNVASGSYRGEIKVPVINLGRATVRIERGMRIAQMLVTPVPRIVWQEVEQLPDSDRGSGGFGHTGH